MGQNNFNFSESGIIINVINKTFIKGELIVINGKISQIIPKESVPNQYILPGFVDSHIHIESSMLIPSEFARLAVIHGTVSTISDPHEIANVCGMEGVKYMIRNGKKVPFKFNFGAPSCVPATAFETTGAELGLEEVEELLQNPEIKYLTEMMNFPGVLNNDPVVMAKIESAKKHRKVIDGHAPGLRGSQAEKYIKAGISTDHECFTKEEALDKLKHGMKILIREGSAAKNFEALYSLIDEFPELIMLCSDDKHPDELVKGHLNVIAARAVAKGCDLMNVLRALTINPVKHYGLDVGLLQPNDPADFIIVKDLERFEVMKTYIDGKLVAENGKSLIDSMDEECINNFSCDFIDVPSIHVKYKPGNIKVIQPFEGQLITDVKLHSSEFLRTTQQDNENDILKLVVVNRYQNEIPAVGYIHGFGINKGAIASTVAHDSHNIIAVGADDHSIVKAINALIKEQGGVVYANEASENVLPLPVAGLMSNKDAYKVAAQYEAIDKLVKSAGTKLQAPFMTLSFMALLVIPKLKLSDQGLFDGEGFGFTELVG